MKQAKFIIPTLSLVFVLSCQARIPAVSTAGNSGTSAVSASADRGDVIDAAQDNRDVNTALQVNEITEAKFKQNRQELEDLRRKLLIAEGKDPDAEGALPKIEGIDIDRDANNEINSSQPTLPQITEAKFNKIQDEIEALNKKLRSIDGKDSDQSSKASADEVEVDSKNLNQTDNRNVATEQNVNEITEDKFNKNQEELDEFNKKLEDAEDSEKTDESKDESPAL